jgi:hypothetical protein
MSGETPEAPDPESQSSWARAQDVHGDAVLAERLVTVERAYAELLQRVRWYERERAELKSRLEELLTRLADGASHPRP